MATQSETNRAIQELQKRIRERRPANKKIRRAFVRIGNRVVALAKERAPVDKGALQNSIQFKISQTDKVNILSIGSFGIPYARFQEFGFNGSVQIREHTRIVRQAFGFVLPEPKVEQVRSHTRNINYPGQPYLRPAFDKERPRMVKIIRQEIRRG